MRWVVDATVLIALGGRDALDLLLVLGDVVLPPRGRDEVTHEPEATNLASFLEEVHAGTPPPETAVERARAVLDDDAITGDTVVIASVIDADGGIGVVSDDWRSRTIAGGLGADVTGTIGVVVHAVRRGLLAPGAARGLVSDIDRDGVHRTGALLDTADRSINEAA